MASVRHGGSNRRALSGKRAILKSALIKVSFVVLVMECTTRLKSGVLSGTHVRFGLFRHRNGRTDNRVRRSPYSHKGNIGESDIQVSSNFQL